MSNSESESALDATEERLTAAKEVRPKAAALAGAHPRRMIAVPGLDMLRRTGFTADRSTAGVRGLVELIPDLVGLARARAETQSVEVEADERGV